jgi:hypothetical protein
MSKKKQRKKLAAVERQLAATKQQIYNMRLGVGQPVAQTVRTKSLADSYSRFRLSQLVGKSTLEHLVNLARPIARRELPCDLTPGDTVALLNRKLHQRS